MPVDSRAWSPVVVSDLLGFDSVDPVVYGQHVTPYLSFSPTDVFVYVHFPLFDAVHPGSHMTRFIGTIMMLSISAHRDKFPVSVLGRVAPIGYTAGHRTVAGSIGFHIFDQSVVEEMGWYYAKMANYSRPPRIDEFPPFDMTLAFVSEDGAAAQAALRGVTILDDGYALQIDDPASRIVMSYMALDYEPPVRVGGGRVTTSPGIVTEPPSDTGQGAVYGQKLSPPAEPKPGPLVETVQTEGSY